MQGDGSTRSQTRSAPMDGLRLELECDFDISRYHLKHDIIPFQIYSIPLFAFFLTLNLTTHLIKKLYKFKLFFKKFY